MPREHKLTDWDLGNDIMHKLCDTLADISRECRKTHPAVADMLTYLRWPLGKLANKLMDDSIAPEGPNA